MTISNCQVANYKIETGISTNSRTNLVPVEFVI